MKSKKRSRKVREERSNVESNPESRSEIQYADSYVSVDPYELYWGGSCFYKFK